jgi:hypothetical protein
MAKASRAKIKMTQARIAREAAARRAAKSDARNSTASNSEVDLDAYAAVDGAWLELGLAAPARRALIDEGLYKVSDLRKYSLDAIKDLHGMGPNAIRILITAMKKSDISFRK